MVFGTFSSIRACIGSVVRCACRVQDIEAALVKQDLQKQKLKQQQDQPAAVAKAAELNDPTMVRARGKLMLPAPQISEAELEAIAKGGGAGGLDADLVEGAGGDATRRLLGNYDTPARHAALPVGRCKPPVLVTQNYQIGSTQ